MTAQDVFGTHKLFSNRPHLAAFFWSVELMSRDKVWTHWTRLFYCEKFRKKFFKKSSVYFPQWDLRVRSVQCVRKWL